MSDTLEQPATGVVRVNVLRSQMPTVLAADKDDLLGKLAAELKGFKADISTPRGREECASKAMKVSKTKTALLKLADAASEEARKTHKAIVAEKKVIEGRLDELRDSVRAPLDEYEAAEQARVLRNSEAIKRMMALSNVAHFATSDEIGSAMAELHTISERAWCPDFKARASDVYADVKDLLETVHKAALRREQEAKELARLRAEKAAQEAREAEEARQRERAELARKAAEAARVEAEQRAARELAAEREAAAKREREAQEAIAKAEQAARDAAAKAERDRLQAEAAVRENEARAERERLAAAVEADRRQKAAVEAERRRLEAAAAAARKQEEDERKAAEGEAAKRSANQAHRQKINREILAALVAAGLSEAAGKTLITEIARQKIPHVSIAY